MSRRVKDTIELGLNVRKSFTIQQNLNNNQAQQQHQQNERNYNHLDYKVVPFNVDASRDKYKRDENFKKRYSRLNDHRCFLNALSWVRFRMTLSVIVS